MSAAMEILNDQLGNDYLQNDLKNKACDCHSYNADIGTVREIVLNPKDYFDTETDKTVCIDACIAPQIKALWKAGVWTVGSCCGHGGKFSPKPEVIIADNENSIKAHKILKECDKNRDWNVLQWQLNRTDPVCGNLQNLLVECLVKFKDYESHGYKGNPVNLIERIKKIIGD